jgi:hypothetical protein
MATLKTKPSVKIVITLELSEEEARALVSLTEYGEKQFLDVFYSYLGRFSLEKHEDGLRALFSSVAAVLPKLLKQADQARAIFNDENK